MVNWYESFIVLFFYSVYIKVSEKLLNYHEFICSMNNGIMQSVDYTKTSIEKETMLGHLCDKVLVDLL